MDEISYKLLGCYCYREVNVANGKTATKEALVILYIRRGLVAYLTPPSSDQLSAVVPCLRRRSCTFNPKKKGRTCGHVK